MGCQEAIQVAVKKADARFHQEVTVLRNALTKLKVWSTCQHAGTQCRFAICSSVAFLQAMSQFFCFDVGCCVNLFAESTCFDERAEEQTQVAQTSEDNEARSEEAAILEEELMRAKEEKEELESLLVAFTIRPAHSPCNFPY